MNDDLFGDEPRDNTMLAMFGWAVRWDELRKFGNTPIAKFTLLVPLIGYLILFNDKLSAYYSLDLALGGATAGAAWKIEGASLTWRLHCLYLGLTSIAFGQLIYGFACPRLVKEYGSAAEFYRVEGPSILIHRLKSMRGYNENWLTYDGQTSIMPEPRKAELMVTHFVPLKIKWPKARVATGVFYGTGLLLTAIPAVWTTLQILWLIFLRLAYALNDLIAPLLPA